MIVGIREGVRGRRGSWVTALPRNTLLPGLAVCGLDALSSSRCVCCVFPRVGVPEGGAAEGVVSTEALAVILVAAVLCLRRRGGCCGSV